MTSKNIFVALALATASVLTSAAHADPTTIELGGFVGFHYFSPDDRLGRHPSTPENALESTADLGMRLGLMPSRRYGFELELALMPTFTKSGIQVLAIGYRAQLLVNLLTSQVQPFVAIGGGGITSSSADGANFRAETDGELHLGAGVKWDVRPHWGLRVDARVTFQPAVPSYGTYFTEDFEFLLGLYGRVATHKEIPPVKDSDGDGLPDDQDKCPLQPGSHELQGCPDVDSDHDGVPDRLDKCPTVAGRKENAGCPDKDTDGDGVVDRMDKCPTVPGPVENAGCPEPDADGDGIIDRLDKCPTVKGPADNAGCPDVDKDADGLIDRLDKCPAEPESKNGYLDEDGCPDEIPPALAKILGPATGVTFAAGKAEPSKKSAAALAAVAAVVKSTPGFTLAIEAYVVGGDKNAAQKLAQSRADAVKAALVTLGVDGARLVATGNRPETAEVTMPQTETSATVITSAGPMTTIAPTPVVPDKTPKPKPGKRPDLSFRLLIK